MPFVVPRDLELSRRRASGRESVLVFLAIVGEATIEEIAEATGIRPTRVVGIMEGLEREYARDLSLVVQRAAVPRKRQDATRYAITSLGARVANEVLERIRAA